MAPGITTLALVRDLAKSRADMVGSSFVTDAEWLAFINGSYYELWGLLCTAFGEDYAVATAQATTDGVNDRIVLPDDFFKLQGVDLQASGTPTGWVTLKRFQFQERNKVTLPFVPVSGIYAPRIRYRINDGYLWLSPLPAAGLGLRIHYTPRLYALVNDSDPIDGVSGWEEYIVVDAARKALLKEESDVSELVREKTMLIQRIEAEAANRDPGEPPSVADVERGGVAITDGYGTTY